MPLAMELQPLPKAVVHSTTKDDLESHPPDRTDDVIPPEIQQLLPVDRGYHALTFLAAATMIETLVWGFPFSVGVLHEYWTTVKFKDRRQNGILSTAATVQSGFLFMAAIAQGPLLQAFPRQRLRLQILGLVCGATSLVGSAFVTEPWHLLLTMGVLYPLSGLLYLPAATLIFEWFVERRGMASGIMYSGTGVGGFVFPFLMSGLIERFGYRAGMCGVVGGYIVLGGIALIFIRPQIPIPSSASDATRHESRQDGRSKDRLWRWKDTMLGRGSVNLSFLQRSTFYAFVGNILLSSMSNFLPAVYVPTYASNLGISKPNGTVLLAIMNGFATNAGVLVAFVVLFGSLGLSFAALWPKLITVIASPISSALLRYSSMNGSAGGYGEHNYGTLLVYTGTMMVLGGICGITYRP